MTGGAQTRWGPGAWRFGGELGRQGRAESGQELNRHGAEGPPWRRVVCAAGGVEDAGAGPVGGGQITQGHDGQCKAASVYAKGNRKPQG